jgi:hypothetical protein
LAAKLNKSGGKNPGKPGKAVLAGGGDLLSKTIYYDKLMALS